MNIKVSNLDRSTSEEELIRLFEEFGEVSDVTRGEFPDPGKDTFSAFVEMPYSSEAEEAIDELDGDRIDGRFIKVREATEAEFQSAQSDEDWEEDWEDESLDKPWQPIVRKRPPKEQIPMKKRSKRPKR